MRIFDIGLKVYEQLCTRLMQVPTPYIVHAIAYELCHLVEHNHGPRCYALPEKVMPNWREQRRGLNRCEVG